VLEWAHVNVCSIDRQFVLGDTWLDAYALGGSLLCDGLLIVLKASFKLLNFEGLDVFTEIIKGTEQRITVPTSCDVEFQKS